MLDQTTDTDSDTVSALLRARRPGYTLPAGLYARADAYAADLDAIFHRHWILAGVEADVPEPGDVYAVDIGRSSIALVRGEDAVVRAFHNVCSHRGARLLDPGPGTVGRLVCPYHQWSYELTGELAQAPHMGAGFDLALGHLRPVHLRGVGGLLYVCLAAEPPADIADLEAVMAPRLAPYGLERARVAHESALIEHGNWKLVMENNRECYHCAANHPELCVAFVALDFGYDPEALSPEDRVAAAEHAALYAARSAEWEARGLPSAPVERTAGCATNFRTQRLIVANGGESHTPDGRAACSRPLGGTDLGDVGDLHLWGINSWVHVLGDHAVVVAAWPLGPDRTLVHTRWLVAAEAVEGRDYDRDRLIAVWSATNAQDGALVARAQAGVASTGYRPGPYSRFTEAALDEFATWYVERMIAGGY